MDDRVTVFLTVGRDAPANRVQELKSLGAPTVSRFHGAGPIAVVLPRQAAERLQRVPWAASAVIDTTTYFLADDVVPWGVDSINADLVHSRQNNRGAGIKIAFLDNGVDCTQPDLNGRIKGGYDFTRGSSTYCTGSGSAHGTAVAGVLGAKDEGTGIVGIAPEADLYSLRVCGAGGCETGWMYDALNWARTHGMQVVTASIGDCGDGTPGLLMQIAIAPLHGAGIPQTWAAGNGSANPPCTASDPVGSITAYSYTIAVAAHSQSGAYKVGYQYGPEIDISAPTDVRSVGDPSFGGTSAATPHVAGTLALLIKEGFHDPDLLLRRITETARDRATAGKDNFYGWGLLDAGAAVTPRARVTNLSWCTGEGINRAGACTMTASYVNGVAPVQMMFEVTCSNSTRKDTHGWGSATRSINVPAGSYTMYVRQIPRDATYGRVGFSINRAIPVCTAPALAVAQSTEGRTVINAPPGCEGDGDPF